MHSLKYMVRRQLWPLTIVQPLHTHTPTRTHAHTHARTHTHTYTLQPLRNNDHLTITLTLSQDKMFTNIHLMIVCFWITTTPQIHLYDQSLRAQTGVSLSILIHECDHFMCVLEQFWGDLMVCVSCVHAFRTMCSVKRWFTSIWFNVHAYMTMWCVRRWFTSIWLSVLAFRTMWCIRRWFTSIWFFCTCFQDHVMC